MSPCKFYKEIPIKDDEIGGGGISSIIFQRPTCVLQLLVAINEWENCRTTSTEGPCWDMKGEIKSSKDWESWVRNRIQTIT